MGQNNRGHSLHAFTREGDFIPTLYVVGQIKAKGDLVGIRLEEVAWSELKPNTLGLKFVPDDYDPNGPVHVQITPFHKPLESDGQYKNVAIESQEGNIHLEVVRLKRKDELSFAAEIDNTGNIDTDVKMAILNTAGQFSADPNDLETGTLLKENLNFNDNDFASLTRTLNKVIKNYKNNVTLNLADVGKCKKVSDVIKLVKEKTQ